MSKCTQNIPTSPKNIYKINSTSMIIDHEKDQTGFTTGVFHGWKLRTLGKFTMKIVFRSSSINSNFLICNLNFLTFCHKLKCLLKHFSCLSVEWKIESTSPGLSDNMTSFAHWILMQPSVCYLCWEKGNATRQKK